jgi:hypothetical protein
VVCGHIHHAEMRDIDGVLYCNDGDWVESLTALVEHPTAGWNWCTGRPCKRSDSCAAISRKAVEPELASRRATSSPDAFDVAA